MPAEALKDVGYALALMRTEGAPEESGYLAIQSGPELRGGPGGTAKTLVFDLSSTAGLSFYGLPGEVHLVAMSMYDANLLHIMFVGPAWQVDRFGVKTPLEEDAELRYRTLLRDCFPVIIHHVTHGLAPTHLSRTATEWPIETVVDSTSVWDETTSRGGTTFWVKNEVKQVFRVASMQTVRLWKEKAALFANAASAPVSIRTVVKSSVNGEESAFLLSLVRKK